MSAPTYHLVPHPVVQREGLFRVSWAVTDGIGGPVLASGHRRTKGSAQLDVTIAKALIKPSPRRILQDRLAGIVGWLDRQGLQVDARIDEGGRVCVRPLCACSTRDEVRVLRAFLAITGAVRWEACRG